MKVYNVNSVTTGVSNYAGVPDKETTESNQKQAVLKIK